MIWKRLGSCRLEKLVSQSSVFQGCWEKNRPKRKISLYPKIAFSYVRTAQEIISQVSGSPFLCPK